MPEESGPTYPLAHKVRIRQVWLYRKLEGLPFLRAPLQTLVGAVWRRGFTRSLHHIHDVLSDTALEGRYWVWGGLLLGWAREGRPLSHDFDADFAVLSSDQPIVESLVPLLRSAGIRPWLRYLDNAGTMRLCTFLHRGIRYDFFFLDDDGSRFRYYLWDELAAGYNEVEARIPAQPRVPFNFLGRTWLKVADHDRELTAIYGNWRVPQTDWVGARDEKSIVGRERWLHASDLQWDPEPDYENH